THTDVVGATASSTATAGEGYEFVGWYDVAGNQVGAGSLSDDGRTISYITTGDATYYARFRRTASEENVTQTFVRQVEDGETWEETTDDSIGILTLYSDTDVVGKEVSSTAAAGEGNEFAGWYDEEGNPVGEDKLSDEGRTLSYATTGNATYYARFKKSASEENLTQTNNPKIEDEETEDDTISVENMIQTKVNQVKNGETLKDASKDISKDISKDTSNDTPQTGDDSNPALWLMLMLLSMSALEGLFIRKKKDRK
ncbi:MAG: LPXTG cell wall anchor domain-containing protein, partial [Lachnospiraceae bacterium]|nr:LPXTG cell wall anchor domain-containing protein [Lachnospiraceae bacterium]